MLPPKSRSSARPGELTIEKLLDVVPTVQTRLCLPSLLLIDIEVVPIILSTCTSTRTTIFRSLRRSKSRCRTNSKSCFRSMASFDVDTPRIG